jgi:hypothetical protein
MEQFFPREQILTLKSEDLFSDPSTVFKLVIEYLSLPHWEPKEYRRYYSGGYTKMNTGVRKRLVDYFAHHNEKLYQYLSRDFAWDG